MPDSVELAHQSLGSHGTPLIIVHGLFGSKRNWQSIASAFAEKYKVFLVDLRNHGASPHSAVMDYPHLAQDLVKFIEKQNLPKSIILGHSLGGKVAMYLALKNPSLIERLIVVDIAPVSYPHRFIVVLEALNSMPLTDIKSRQDADRHLSKTLPDKSLRQFLLQNLVYHEGQYRWRINLPTITKTFPEIAAFPEFEEDEQFDGPSLFIGGEESNYVGKDYLPSIGKYFPNADIKLIPDAGHWVHAEQPEAFYTSVENFLRS